MNREQAAAYDVLLDGASIGGEQLARIEEIRVVDHIKLPDVCTVTITYPVTEGTDSQPIDSQPFEIGKKLEVRLGKPDELPARALFKGDVVTLEPEFRRGGCGLTVRAIDKAHVLLRSRHVRTFQNQTSSDIVAKIVEEAGLRAEVEPSGDPHDFIQQVNETDWDFGWRLAERIGFELVAAGSVVHFRKPSADSSVALTWPGTLRSFSPRVTAVQQVNSVTLKAYDPRTKRAIESSATAPEHIPEIGISHADVTRSFQESRMHVATEPVMNQDQADRLTQALFNKLASGYTAADGVVEGNPNIKAGTKVEVSGVGVFSGAYRVATAAHVLSSGGYATSFSSSPTHTVRGALVAGNNGNGSDAPLFATQLVLGVVTNNNDPEGLGRVRVKYPALGDESTWARVVWPSAGKERGLMMLPVVGEEVLIGFEGNTTTRPYVLGSLFNGLDTPGDDLVQQRNGSFALRSDRDIYTESQKDFSQKSGGRLIVEIAGNAEEKFQADWTNETEGSVSLSAGQPFKVEGQSVIISGSTQVTIEGGATLSLKGGGSEITLSSGGVTLSGPTITGKGVPSGSLAKS